MGRQHQEVNKVKKRILWFLGLLGMSALLLTAIPGTLALDEDTPPCTTEEGAPGDEGECGRRNCCTKWNAAGNIADRMCIPKACPTDYDSRPVDSCSLECPK